MNLANGREFFRSVLLARTRKGEAIGSNPVEIFFGLICNCLRFSYYSYDHIFIQIY